MRDVPPDTTVVGMPARIVKRNGQRVEEELPRTSVAASVGSEPRDSVSARAR
jgi:serine acetyltransferase